MGKHIILITLFFVGLIYTSLPLNAQNVVLSGRVTDSTTGEPLIGASVYNSQRRSGTTTNSMGYYSLTLPSQRQLELTFSYVGYSSETQTMTLKADSLLNIKLRQGEYILNEVQVYGTKHNFGPQSSQMSAIAVSAEQIRRMPVVLGEPDVLKTLQKLPGVQSTGDGKAGIYVRGGDYDQNLFLLDGVTLYNPQHLQGFTSAINADMVDDVVLYKGAFPARFGSRLSSVINVSLQEGDVKRHHIAITSGMLTSRLQADGPLWKGHTSYNIAARVSYFNAIVKPLLEEVIYDNPGQMNDYSHMRYWDINAKLTHKFSDIDKLSIVFYKGHDVNNATPLETSQNYRYDKWVKEEGSTSYTSVAQGYIDNDKRSETRNSWSNILGGINYSHVFSPSLDLNIVLSYSGYDYKLSQAAHTRNWTGIDIWNHGHDGAQLYSLTNTKNFTSYHSKVSDLAAKIELVYTWNNLHEIHGGVQAGYQQLNPIVETRQFTSRKVALSEAIVWNIGLGEDRYTYSESNVQNHLTDKSILKTLNAYVEDDLNISKNLRANIGLRFQGYETDGATNIILEPRTSLRWLLAKNTALKASYSRMSQGIFLLSSANLITPSEMWITPDKNMDIGISDQISIGVSHDFKSGIQLSVEGYYKWLDGVVEYREGGSFIKATGWNQLIAQGEGKAYGVELLAQKTIGNTKGMIGYTWSKSLRTFNRENMTINHGKEFYANGDRRHNFNISIMQRLSKNWDLSAAWTYQSGRRVTFATTTLSGLIPDEFNNYYPSSSEDWTIDYTQNPAFSDITGIYYEDTYGEHLLRMSTYMQRNSYSLPAVHRLDVGLSHHGSVGIGEMICDIGIYNLYNQQNVSSVYWGYKNSRPVLKGVCMFPIMPYISLTLKL